MSVKITRTDLTAGELRREASREANAAAARRMLALALVLEGQRRADAARQCGMDRQTLRDWMHRFNDDGLAGLFDRDHGGGAPRKLSSERWRSGCEPAPIS
jgi:transposase